MRSGSRGDYLRRVARSVYDAQRGGRMLLLDGPAWLAVTLLVTVGVLVLGDAPWTWLAALVLFALFLLPLGIRWVVALSRSVSAVRDGYR